MISASVVVEALRSLMRMKRPGVVWRKIWSTNPLEQANMDIKPRTNVVAVFPTTGR